MFSNSVAPWFVERMFQKSLNEKVLPLIFSAKICPENCKFNCKIELVSISQSDSGISEVSRISGISECSELSQVSEIELTITSTASESDIIDLREIFNGDYLTKVIFQSVRDTEFQFELGKINFILADILPLSDRVHENVEPKQYE